MTGAQFEIRIDGTPRSYRDRKWITRWRPRGSSKAKNPHSMVEVKDHAQSGDVTAVAIRPG